MCLNDNGNGPIVKGNLLMWEGGDALIVLSLKRHTRMGSSA